REVGARGEDAVAVGLGRDDPRLRVEALDELARLLELAAVDEHVVVVEAPGDVVGVDLEGVLEELRRPVELAASGEVAPELDHEARVARRDRERLLEELGLLVGTSVALPDLRLLEEPRDAALRVAGDREQD